MESWEVEARLAIGVLLMTYTRCVDKGDAAGIAVLFTEPCLYDMKNVARCTNHAEIIAGVGAAKAFFDKAPPDYVRPRHHVSSQWIEFASPTEARAGSYFVVMCGYGVDHWGTYRDKLVKVDGEWKITERLAGNDGAVAKSPLLPTV